MMTGPMEPRGRDASIGGTRRVRRRCLSSALTTRGNFSDSEVEEVAILIIARGVLKLYAYGRLELFCYSKLNFLIL